MLKSFYNRVYKYFLGLLICLTSFSGYGQTTATNPKNSKVFLEENNNHNFLWEMLNSPAYAMPEKKNNKKYLRKRWQNLLGIDIFYPYFQAKKVEKIIKEKAQVNIFKIKGEPEFSKERIQYIFKIKF